VFIAVGWVVRLCVCASFTPSLSVHTLAFPLGFNFLILYFLARAGEGEYLHLASCLLWSPGLDVSTRVLFAAAALD
jgi:hypothetical protein